MLVTAKKTIKLPEVLATLFIQPNTAVLASLAMRFEFNQS